MGCRRARTPASRALAALLAVVATALATIAAAAPTAAARGLQDAGLKPPALDLKLERTGPIKDSAYGRMPPMGENGELGVNQRGSSYFSLAHQQLADLYVRSGIVRSKRRRVLRGLSAYDYAFRFQAPNGAFPVRQVEEYAFFVQSLAHSILLLRESKYADFLADQLDDYELRLARTARHMLDRDLWRGFVERNRWYTHTGYTMGTALSLSGRVTRNGKLRRYGRKAIKLALSRQRGDGVNPELGGYDVRYQMAGIVYAERFRVYFPRGRLAQRVQRMTNRGIKWMRGRVDQDGWIDWRGSTRSCTEGNTAGGAKSPGYSYAIRGFAYWGRLLGREHLLRRAKQMNDYVDRQPKGTLCGPKQSVSAADAPSQRRGIDPARLNDLYE